MMRVLLAGIVAALVMAGPALAQVVALGASNTAGLGVGVGAAFPAQLAAMLKAEGKPVRVTNQGVSGHTTADMLARLNSAVPAGTKVVIVQYGGNDFRRSMSGAQRSANIAAIEQKLAARGIAVVQADRAVRSGLSGGMALPDGTHLTREGHRAVAAQLLPHVKGALH